MRGSGLVILTGRSASPLSSSYHAPAMRGREPIALAHVVDKGMEISR